MVRVEGADRVYWSVGNRSVSYNVGDWCYYSVSYWSVGNDSGSMVYYLTTFGHSGLG